MFGGWYDISMDNLWIIYGCLVGGLNPTPLKKYEFVNWDDDIPKMNGNIKNVPNHQPDVINNLGDS